MVRWVGSTSSEVNGSYVGRRTREVTLKELEASG